MLGPLDEADHRDGGRGINGAGRVLVVERAVAPRDGRIEGGEPDRLLGYPVVCTADSNGMAVSSIVAGFGDYSYYMIGERSSISIKVAREAFLANNQTGYFGFARNDGKMTLTAAQVHMATAAS